MIFFVDFLEGKQLMDFFCDVVNMNSKGYYVKFQK